MTKTSYKKTWKRDKIDHLPKIDAPKETEDRAEYMIPKMNNIKKQKRRKPTEKLVYLTELWCAVEYS